MVRLRSGGVAVSTEADDMLGSTLDRLVALYRQIKPDVMARMHGQLLLADTFYKERNLVPFLRMLCRSERQGQVKIQCSSATWL